MAVLDTATDAVFTDAQVAYMRATLASAAKMDLTGMSDRGVVANYRVQQHRLGLPPVEPEPMEALV